jgi:hypothetical protein
MSHLRNMPIYMLRHHRYIEACPRVRPNGVVSVETAERVAA